MSQSNQLQERLRRAKRRSDQLDYRVKRDGPLIVECDSEHSGRTHAIVPSALYCSCEDARYRTVPCYHQIGLVLSDLADASEDMLDALWREAQRTAQDSAQAERRNDLAEVLADLVDPHQSIDHPTDTVSASDTNEIQVGESEDSVVEQSIRQAEANELSEVIDRAVSTPGP